MKPLIQKMHPYDGDGYICYVPNGTLGNTGFGDTPADAYASWKRGEDIAEAALAVWASRLSR